MADSQFVFQKRVVPAGEYAPREDSIDIFLIDVQLHTQRMNNPATVLTKVRKSLKNGQPARFLGSGFNVSEDGKITLGINFDEEELINLLEKRKKSRLRIYMPNRMPMALAKDAIEKLKSLEKKLKSKRR